MSKYKKPEIVIKFFKTKIIDFDCRIGFDGEFLLSNGKEETFRFLSKSGNDNVEDIYKHIGNSIENCIYTDKDLKIWEDFKHQYFSIFIQPIKDEMWFFYQTREKAVMKSNLKSWIDSQKKWSNDNIWKYELYSKFLGDKENLERAIQLKSNLK